MSNKFKAKKVESRGDVLLMCSMTEHGLEVHLPKPGGEPREYSYLLASVVQAVAAKFQTDFDAVMAGMLLSKQDVEKNSHVCRVELDEADVH